MGHQICESRFRNNKKMSRRLKYYIRCMYAWAGIMCCVPVKYKFRHGLPDILVPDNRPRIYQSFGLFSTFTVGSSILYWYHEAFFGQTTWVEKMFLIGLNSIFNIMHVSQWQILLSGRRRRGLNVTNSALATAFQNSKSFPVSFEVVCVLACCMSLIYPIIFFPCVLMVAFYLPGAFHHLHQGIDLLVRGIISSSEFNPLYGMVARYVLYAAISVGLGHSVVSCAICGHWIFTYLFATRQRIDDMLR